jgi:hypothetical protein
MFGEKGCQMRTSEVRKLLLGRERIRERPFGNNFQLPGETVCELYENPKKMNRRWTQIHTDK